MRVGFIGLGAMGLPMARRLLTAGHQLVVHNRSRTSVDELVSFGASAAGSPVEVAASCDVVLTMLPTEDAVRQVVLGAGGVRESGDPPEILVDLSTVSPATVAELVDGLRSAGTAVVDAPVSGGVPAAVEGSLAVMVGGSSQAVERVRPLLDVLGSTVMHVGPSGSGQTVKAANQVLVAGIIQSVSEAIVLLDAAGADTAAALEVIGRGLGGNRILDLKKAALLSRDFTPSGRAELHHKDLGIALALARERHVFLPVTALIDQFYSSLAAQGLAGHDHTALLELADRLSATPRGRPETPNDLGGPSPGQP